jgi:hypothetical protein
MSDNAGKPEQPEPRDPWAPPEQQVPLDKPRQGIPPTAEQPTLTAMPSPDGTWQPGPHSPPPGGSGAVPPPPIAPTGPGPSAPPNSAGPSYGTGYGSGGPYGGYPGYSGYPGSGYGPGWHPMPAAPSNGMGVASLVLGIIGTVLFFTSVLAIILGVLAIIFGAIGRARASRGEAVNGGQALAGLILGVVAVIVGTIILVAVIADAQGDFDNSTDADPYATALVLGQVTR